MTLQPPALAVARRCILVVDDDQEARELVDLILSPTYLVRFAVDGFDGCEKAAELPRPDLIVTDVGMPRLDGITMVLRIRTNPTLRRVPVIFFTGHMAASSFIAGLSAAPFAYLSKGSAPGVLAEKVRHALGT